MIFTRQNIIKGGLIYSIGDTIAAFISDEFSWIRLVGILLIGATLYALEIPNYFKWIDKKVESEGGWKTSLYRALLAMLYFNPLWIARHMAFILLLKGTDLNWSLLKIATVSFLVNIPISLIANYVIQNKISLSNRFLASAIFSGLMAIYYAMSFEWFG